MRLLEYTNGELRLTEDLLHNLPEYAILSHTWGPTNEEVTFRDLCDGTGEDKAGYAKIKFCAEQARRDGLCYFWVDTCCIDKSDNNELATAINSMFRWYRNATRCYVYLSGITDNLEWESAFRAHKWFTRGWTLQELLAPASVEFFTQDGRRIGDKRSLEQRIHEITGISVGALRDRDLSAFDVEERFRWAEPRQTTREEDWAYCLLGIFGIFMPLIYGEGKENAIRRLRREIRENNPLDSLNRVSQATTALEENIAPGLTVLCEPEAPSVDIVFVHGFIGRPQDTWICTKSNTRRHIPTQLTNDPFERPSKMRRLNSSFAPEGDSSLSDSGVCWPRDLLPMSIPNARIMAYIYDTRTQHPSGHLASRNKVYDIAWDFLVALEAERRTEPKRPVLFVAHSLGGIIVKEMLRRSRDCDLGQAHLHGVFELTAGMTFFGTPHLGIDSHDFFHRISENLSKTVVFATDAQTISSLLPNPERLKGLASDFSSMAQERNWMIHSFQEDYGIEALFGQKLIDDSSSHLNLPNIEITEHIARNHFEMCQFATSDDPEYKKVAAALSRISSIASTRLSAKKQSTISPEQQKLLLDSLTFDQIDARQMNIKKAHTATCKWLLKKPEYLDWLNPSKLNEHHGLLWIKGKPGSGKSTLMKFTLANARKSMKDALILSFFFNARGSELEKSVIGTYRSLLWQLLKQRPALQDVFESLELATRTSESPQWSVECLEALFEQAVQSLEGSPLTCFIDALDECDEQQIREMISFFERLGEMAQGAGIKFRVCFSSRHYPHIVSKGQDLILEGQEGHTQDIHCYLNSELKIGSGKLAEKIREELLEKASGVFMWIVLVAGILNKEYASGRTHMLRQRLGKIPGDLHELFRDILTRDENNRGEMLLCIQWVLFAKQPLKPEQLYFAILCGIDPEILSECNPDEITSEVMRRFILDSSKGLADVTLTKNGTVQFIHESVKDFLLKENGLREIWSTIGSNFRGESHERLKQSCQAYIDMNITACRDLGADHPSIPSQTATKIREMVNKRFPFLEYATQNVLFHADAAEESGINQDTFIHKFQSALSEWIILNNLFERHDVRRCKEQASLMYILAERDLGALVKGQLSTQSCFAVEKGRYGTPIFAALATNSEKAVASFVKFEQKLEPPESPIHRLGSQFSSDCVQFSRQFHFSRGNGVYYTIADKDSEEFLALFIASGQAIATGHDKRTLITNAVRKGHEKLVDALVTTDKELVNIKSKYGQPMLSLAAEMQHEPVIRLLLKHGADVDITDLGGQTPLSWAARGQSESIVRLLLEHGAYINSKESTGLTPLLLAAGGRSEGIVRLLLEQGADVESRGDGGRIPLSTALDIGVQSIIRLLLTYTTCVETRDVSGRTPLSWAAEKGDETTVQELIKKGAYIESKDGHDRTPLWWAIQQDNMSVVQLLLEQGADVRVRAAYDMETVLFKAVYKGNEAVVKLLLIHGADIESRGSLGQTPLSYAAAESGETMVQTLIAQGADIESKDSCGRTPLWWAISQHKTAVVQLLLEKGASIHWRGRDGHTLLSEAVCNRQGGIIRLLLAHGADIESKDDLGRTPLSLAASKSSKVEVMILARPHRNGNRPTCDEDAEILQLLLTHGADIEARDNFGRTPLAWAAGESDEASIQILLDHDADPNSRDIFEQTPLLWPVARGDEAIVHLLLSKGANIQRDNNHGRLLLALAAERGDENLASLLIANVAEIDSMDETGYSPLICAALRGHPGVIRLLLKSGASIDAKDESGQTALSWAATAGRDDIVRLLLDHGANIDLPDNIGQTPLLHAAKHIGLYRIKSCGGTNYWEFLRQREMTGGGVQQMMQIGPPIGNRLISDTPDLSCKFIAKMQEQIFSKWTDTEETTVTTLLRKGANMELRDDMGRTPLSYAVEMGNVVVTQLLIGWGADLESRDKEQGWTPLLWAIGQTNLVIARLLLEKGANAEASDNSGHTPLSMAIEYGDAKMISLVNSHLSSGWSLPHTRV